jgi:hypothetical protein
VIEQAIYANRGSGGYQFLARSPGFHDEWLAEAERLCTGFGERPEGATCPGALFARPFGRQQVAVVQVADQGIDDAGRPGALGFRILVLPRELYHDLASDPFFISEHLAPPWTARGSLPALEWTAGAPPRRTVEGLRKVLDVPYSPTLLGGVQALLDGGSLVFERSSPAPELVSGLWALLPLNDRSHLWPATFCFGNAHHFDVVVLPRANETEVVGYIPEEQAGDYPEGKYEWSLQLAVESSNQGDLDHLLARRSRPQAFRLMVGLLVVAMVVAFVTATIPTPPPPRTAAPPSTLTPRSTPAPPTSARRPTPTPPPSPRVRPPLVLPPVEECPQLPSAQQRNLAAGLKDLARRLGIGPLTGTMERAAAGAKAWSVAAQAGRNLPLTAGSMPYALDMSESLLSPPDLVTMVNLLDEHLGTPSPDRSPGPLANLGPIQRQLRALLWKHNVPSYDDRRLNTVELLDCLRARLEESGALKERTGG